MSPDATCPYEKPNHDEIIAQISIQTFSALLSIVGSAVIIYIVMRGRCQLLRDHLLLGMSIFDILSSIALGLSVIPTPQVTACSTGMGNLTTCTIQGFFLQLSFAVPGYQAMLSVFYLMTIKYQMDPTILVGKFETMMHLYVLIPTLTLSIIGAAEELYFSEKTECWIGDKCMSIGNCPDGNIWGRGFWIVNVTLIYCAINMFITVASLIAIKISLQNLDVASQRHVFHPSVHRRQSRVAFMANESFKQALLYAGAYFITYMCSVIYIVANLVGLSVAMLNQRWFYLVQGFFLPLLGFWNFFVYVCPMVSQIQRRSVRNSISFMSAVIIIIRGQQRYFDERRLSVRRRLDIEQIDYNTVLEVEIPTTPKTENTIPTPTTMKSQDVGE